MKQGTGELIELFLEKELTGGRILCPQSLVPSPGQYLLAHDPASDDILPASVFNAGSVPGGFLAAPPIPPTWRPGTTLSLRGPLGRGFTIPTSAQHVALVALGDTFARLKPLLLYALEQNASIAIISDLELHDLPPEVEIQSISALAEVAQWSDYLAIDVEREKLSDLREKFWLGEQVGGRVEAQILIVTPMPCGGMGDCGVCAVTVRRGWKMACKDGPVINLSELMLGKI